MREHEMETIVLQPESRKRRVPKRTAPSASGSTSLLHVLQAIFVAGGLVFLVWAMHNWMRNSNAFLLQKIDIHGTRILRAEDIRNELRIGQRVRLTDVELGQIEARLRRNPFIRSVLVSRKFPSTLDVEIEERVPVAYISGREKMWMVDEEGVVLPPLTGSRALNLPVIVGMRNFPEKPAAVVQNQQILQAVWLLATTRALDKNLFYRMDNVSYSRNRGLVIYLTRPALPLYFGKNPDVRQIEYVRAILQKLKREHRLASARYIDLRFEKQVVVG